MESALIIGGGGREVAITGAIQESLHLDPYANKSAVQIAEDAETGLQAIYNLELDNPLIVIGPEAPLVDGLADRLRKMDYLVLGPSQTAASYESDKAKTVRLAQKYGIVHPETFIAEGEDLASASLDYIRNHQPENYVIKANGLAAGKGVILPKTDSHARQTVAEMIDGGFSGAGKDTILFAKRKKGPEVSAMVLVGGGKDDFMLLPLAQDYKRLKDGDEGPNTGGMGAYAPVPEMIVSPAQQKAIEQKAYKLLDAMEKEGTPFNRGVMYMGLMLSEDLEGDEPDLIEINVRLGDPETQVIMPLLSSAGVNVYSLLRSAAEGKLIRPKLNLSDIGRTALTVCLASEGYPDKPIIGEVIHGLDKIGITDNLKIYLAGAKPDENGQYVTTGGRVLYVTGLGEHLYEAVRQAYSAIGDKAIHFSGMQFRSDIGEFNQIVI